jgi:hypothetical protein
LGKDKERRFRREKKFNLRAAVLNISKLETILTMDHAVYVPGEITVITASGRNPGNQVLEVINPFWAESAGFDLLKKPECSHVR